MTDTFAARLVKAVKTAIWHSDPFETDIDPVNGSDLVKGSPEEYARAAVVVTLRELANRATPEELDDPDIWYTGELLYLADEIEKGGMA